MTENFVCSNSLKVPLKGGHFLQQELGAFDAPFFSISASEAEAMDPQSRALLETTYRALENGKRTFCRPTEDELT